MNINKLRRYTETDITQEFGRTRSKLVEELDRALAQSLQIVLEAMQMDDFLLELAPELFNGIAPGGIGRQRDQLDRKVPGAEALARPLTGFTGPIGS